MLRFALALCLALPAATLAQVTGHGSVPQSGPAAQERGRSAGAEDPVLVQLERIRVELADVGKRYRKAKATQRPELARRLAPALEEIASLVGRLEPASPQAGLR